MKSIRLALTSHPILALVVGCSLLYERRPAGLRGLSPSSLANKRSRLGRFDRYFANRLAADIAPLDCDEYAATRREEGVTNATINRDLAVARHVFNWARGKRLLRENPLDAYELFEEERSVRHVDEDEIKRVMNHLPAVQRDGIFRFIYETGCRKSEATGLLWEDVNPELRIARARRTKPGKDRYHSLPAHSTP